MTCIERTSQCQRTTNTRTHTQAHAHAHARTHLACFLVLFVLVQQQGVMQVRDDVSRDGLFLLVCVCGARNHFPKKEIGRRHKQARRHGGFVFLLFGFLPFCVSLAHVHAHVHGSIAWQEGQQQQQQQQAPEEWEQDQEGWSMFLDKKVCSDSHTA